MFKKAVKHESKLRLAIAGPSGSGKTYTALAVGTALGKVAFADTEHGSASKYADLFDFDVVNIQPPFHPDKFVEVIKQAAAMGYDVVILDSLTHAWNGSGGLLEVVDEIAKRMKTVNTFAAWKDATPIQNRLVDSIVTAPIHVIATMRSKQEYVLEQVEQNGRKVNIPRKLGMAPIQRDGLEYEFDVYLDMDIDNNAIVAKTRCTVLQGKVISRPGANLAETLQDWLSGEALPPPPPPVSYEATPLPVVSPERLRALHAAGSSFYGKDWDDKRPELVLSVTGKRTKSSKELTPDEAEKLIVGINKKADMEKQPFTNPKPSNDLLFEEHFGNSQVTGAYQD